MGTIFSQVKDAPSSLRPREQPRDSDESDGEDSRPTKRRRIDLFEERRSVARSEVDRAYRLPLSHVTNGSTRPLRASSKPAPVSPVDFYGKSRATAVPSPAELSFPGVKSLKRPISGLLPATPTDFKNALRLDVTEITSNSDNEIESLGVVPEDRQVDIRCVCSVSIFGATNEEDPNAILPRDYEEVGKMSKTGILRVTIRKDGQVTRELVLKEPFIFPANNFFVNRTSPISSIQSQRQELKYTRALADKYNAVIKLERFGHQKHWPTLIVPPVGDDSPDDGTLAVSSVLNSGLATLQDLYLVARAAIMVDPGRQCRAVNLSACCGNLKQMLPYTIKLQIRWALPSHLTGLPRPVPNFESPKKAASKLMPREAVPDSPGVPAQVDSTPNSPADSRARRQRASIPTYNLKTLSAQAQGKSPRKARTKDSRVKSNPDHATASTGISVTYCFGKADSAELGIRQTTVPSLQCPFCDRNHESINDLRLHLAGNHGSSCKFHLGASNEKNIKFFVEVIKSRSSLKAAAEQSKVFQLSKPVTLFNLENYLKGDDSWVKAREIPEYNPLREHLADKANESSLSSSPHDSRHSSPNTSHDPEDLMEQDGHVVELPVRKRPVFYVPKTKKPLYHTVTKQRLIPGEEIPSSDDEKDETWLHQKHRDIINDFSDITPEEKDYINQWNPFIVDRQLSCDKHLPAAIMDFVQLNKTWFTKKKLRRAQFMKHMETLIMRGVVTQEWLHKCFLILRAEDERVARIAKDAVTGDIAMDGAKEEEEEKPPHKYRGTLDCECCEHTQPPDRVICRGLKCPGRFFHRECAKKHGRPITGPWKCNRCHNL